MFDTDMVHALEAALPQGRVITDPAAMNPYRWDRAYDPEAGVPLAVVRVESTEQTQSVIRLAADSGVPVVPRGAGSGLSGGSTAVEGCIVICTEDMRRIEVDPLTKTAVVQPGAFNAEVKAAAAEDDLWYPPDPSSFEYCSIGGNIATNAGGLCCVKYGVTTDYVLGMRVVLADGRAVRLGGPTVKDVAGLDLTKLFIGSEGTLGVVTEIILRLIPAQRPLTTLVATFGTLDDATEAVLQISSKMRPSMLEFMDQPTIRAVEAATGMGLDVDAAAMLVIQSDEPAEFAQQEIGVIAGLCEANNATDCLSTDDPETGESYVTARRVAIPSVEKLGSLLLEDVGVPLPRLGDLIRGIEEISSEREVLIAVIAHAGDGNTHPLVVFDPTDDDHLRRAHLAYGEVMDLAIALGGTITGEHGVGRMKRPWLEDYVGADVLELNQRIKDALDPQGILNPGAVLQARTRESTPDQLHPQEAL